MLVGVAAMHFTAAGTLGLPLGMFGITPLLSPGMGDEDDQWEWEVEYRQILTGTFGVEAGETIAHGPLRLPLNVDLAARIGLDDLWIRPPAGPVARQDRPCTCRRRWRPDPGPYRCGIRQARTAKRRQRAL